MFSGQCFVIIISLHYFWIFIGVYINFGLVFILLFCLIIQCAPLKFVIVICHNGLLACNHNQGMFTILNIVFFITYTYLYI